MGKNILNKYLNLPSLRVQIIALANKEHKVAKAKFFQTAKGQYGENDKFLGIRNGELHSLSKLAAGLSDMEIISLLSSKYNEERLLALFILIRQFKKADMAKKESILNLYLKNISHVNNWNLVDASAHLIVGAYLYETNYKDIEILFKLAYSKIMWSRRIAIVATWFFIRHDEISYTFHLAKLLLNDEHDLIHKAVGWMLREAGKKNIQALCEFLDEHHNKMPRTMLRYASEKLNKLT